MFKRTCPCGYREECPVHCNNGHSSGECPGMRRFRLYRPNPPENYVKEGYANEVDQVQLEGVVFTDGTVVVRWMTETKSHSVWNSLEDFKKIHGHPEYGTEWIWLDSD